MRTSRDNDASFRFSIIIPTYQRRDLVLAAVMALAHQEFSGGFEVIVVVDGSRDGSAQALRALSTPFPLTVLEHPNQGAANARNRGAAIARGEILVFLDDDMESHPLLLAEHERSHRDGAHVVLGHIPLHPASPASILSIGVGEWADRRARRLSSVDAQLTLHDFLTGQISLHRATFYSVGGFDTSFTRGGTFGNEDVDFGYRLLIAGYRITFNINAISWQRYVVEPRQYMRQWHQAGYADVVFARKHPEQAEEIFRLARAESLLNKWVWRPAAACPLLTGPLIAALRWLAVRLVELGARDRITSKLFFEIRRAEYWRGVHEAGGIPGGTVLRVLAYHGIIDLAGAPVLEDYGVPVKAFRRQLQMLQRLGFRFVSVDEALNFVHGRGGLPRRALLLTFDDCFDELVSVVLPILQKHGIPAVAFAVSGRLGGTNVWDERLGAPQLRLLDGAGLRELARGGVEIGAHSRTHPLLTAVPDAELSTEIGGSVADLEALGLNPPRLFAYPYGENDMRVEREVERAGLQAAFTVDPGFVRPGHARHRLPRIEILRSDTGWKFLIKVIHGRRWAMSRKPLRWPRPGGGVCGLLAPRRSGRDRSNGFPARR